MEKLVFEVAENVFNDIPGFPYRRRTLPEKIIRLRKMSQDCHVRRMKAALRQKQMQGMQGTSDLSMSFSSCSTMSINRTNSSPSDVLNYGNVGKHFDGNKSENSSSKLSNFSTITPCSNERKTDCHSRFTNVNRYKKTTNSSSKNNSVMSDSALDVCCRKKSMIHPNCKINKKFNYAGKKDNQDNSSVVHDDTKIHVKNEDTKDKPPTYSDAALKGNTLSKGSWRPFDNIMDSIHLNRLKMKKEKSYEDSLIKSLENVHLKDTRNKEIGKKYPNTSKIPIFHSRLSSEVKESPQQTLQMINIREPSVKSTENNNISSEASNVNDSHEYCQAKTSKVISKSTTENSLSKCIIQELECNSEENPCDVRILNCKSEELSNNLRSVSKWLQESIAKAEKSDENSNVSQADSLVVDVERSKEKLTQTISTTPKRKVFKTASSLTYSIKESYSGSDDSSDYYYETETGDEVVKDIANRSDEDNNEWEEDSDEDSVALPANIEDKIIRTPDNCAKDKYSNAPDYPKTPYDLRYPRYYSRESNDRLRKFGENSTQLKTPKKKIRRKSRNLTPKIKKSKKAKANLSCKIQASKNKKA